MNTEIKYVTIEKWASLTGVTAEDARVIHEAANDGRISSVRLSEQGSLLVDLNDIDRYLKEVVSVSKPEKQSDREKLIEHLCILAENHGYKVSRRNKYINFYARSANNRVIAQAHLPKAHLREKYKGVFFVVPNKEIFLYHLKDDKTFMCNAKLVDLEGDHGPNSSWLRGNRGTSSEACIFHLPIDMINLELPTDIMDSYRKEKNKWNNLLGIMYIAKIVRGADDPKD